MYGEADTMKTRIGEQSLLNSLLCQSLPNCLLCVRDYLSAAAELDSSKRELDRNLADLRRKISKPFTGQCTYIYTTPPPPPPPPPSLSLYHSHC